MYKIEFLKTGNKFELPENEAKELKSKFPNEYRILEKNGRKFRDRIQCLDSETLGDSIYSKVIETKK